MDILIDIGSTVIKGISNHLDGDIESIFHYYDDRPLKIQVVSVINTLNNKNIDSRVSICSSFNGGLSVGLLCLSDRVSGSVAQHFLESVGSNIRYNVEWRYSKSYNIQGLVDILIIVGGIDSFPVDCAKHALYKLSLDNFPHERLVFAGHNTLAKFFLSRFTHAEHVLNFLNKDIKPSNNKLSEFVRDSYLNDIISKRDVEELKDLSIVNIEPTPLVVSRAFEYIQSKFLSPMVIFDVGGATTDLHFLKELLDEDKLSLNKSFYPNVARHVYTSYGIVESKSSTISRLIDDDNCIQLLMELYGDEYRQIYMNLLDGDVTDNLLFVACIFLAIRDMIIDDNQTPKLQLSRISTIGLTGGAAKCIDKDDIKSAFISATGSVLTSKIVIDYEYRWWGIGMSENDNLLLTT